jgi:Tfp pilus assembly protein PilV
MRAILGHGRRGFNLLEVVIAAFIFSTVSISFLGVWGQQVRALEKSRHLMVATFLAEQLINESMSNGYERTKVTDPAEGPEKIDITMETSSRNPSNPDPENWDKIAVVYHATREVQPSGNPDVDKLKQVIVKVAWEDTTKKGEVVLETFLAGVQ